VAQAKRLMLNPNAPAFVPLQRWTVNAAQANEPGEEEEEEEDGLNRIVTTEAELSEVLKRLVSEKVISVDCEGSDLSKGSWRNGQLAGEHCMPLHGRLCLLQIGTTSGAVFAIDVLRIGSRAFDLGLRQLLETTNVIKVVHDFRQDADALWHQFRVQVREVFDCQLCDVFIRRLAGYRTQYVQGSARLLSAHGIEAETVPGYGLLTPDMKLRIHERFSEDRHLWERRPLPKDMIQYAKADVLPLPRLYRQLVHKLSNLLGDEMLAHQLMRVGSAVYDADFVGKWSCQCRLCCSTEDHARFDGHRVFTQMANDFDPWVLQRLWRPEDTYPLKDPGPSRFYVNEKDESVPNPASALHPSCAAAGSSGQLSLTHGLARASAHSGLSLASATRTAI